MKTKISITVDKNIVEKIEKKLKEGLFRNKSHVVEYALSQFLRK